MSVANKNKKDCCGCGVCRNACPKKCIVMKEDKLGFFYPEVNADSCIECGLCERVCPFEHHVLNLPRKVYAAWNTDEAAYSRSSSGGAAYALGSYVIENGGVVYGCEGNGVEIKHVRVDSIDDLKRLQGSKYVQSNLADIYKNIKSDLESGKTVLFTGTPCQTAAVRNYVGKKDANLYLVDLICHGVPSMKMLHDHISAIVPAYLKSSLKDNSSDVSVSFREGDKYQLKVSAKDFKYCELPHKDTYFRTFLKGTTYRNSCYHCPFGTNKRAGDLTIGDFWGFTSPEILPQHVNSGLSVMLPITEKGLHLMEAVGFRMQAIERTVNEAVAGNDQLNHCVSDSIKAKIFRIAYSMFSFELSAKIAICPEKLNTLKRMVIARLK